MAAGDYLREQHSQLFSDALARAHFHHGMFHGYPAVPIVLSTPWVRVLGYSRTRERLPPGLRKRVIGATYHSNMHPAAFAMLPRGVQVLDDVARRAPRDWLALDDDGPGLPKEHEHRLMPTDERLGLSAPGLAEALSAKLRALAANRPR